MKKPVSTVCAILKNKDKILSISQDQNDTLELPGGSVKPNENPLEAIKREVKEETGLSLINFVKVYDGNLGDERIITYLALDWDGTIKSKGGYQIRWADPADLLSNSYNISLFSSILNRVNSKVSAKTARHIQTACWVVGIIVTMYFLTFWQYILTGILLAVADSIKTNSLVKKNKWMIRDVPDNKYFKVEEKTLFMVIFLGNLFTLVPFWSGELLFIILRSLFPRLDTDDWIFAKFDKQDEND